MENADYEDGFQIYRSSDGQTYDLLAMVGPDVETYLDTGLSGSVTYSYRLCTYSSAGQSALLSASGQPGVSPAPLPITPAAPVLPALGASDYLLAFYGAGDPTAFGNEQFRRLVGDLGGTIRSGGLPYRDYEGFSAWNDLLNKINTNHDRYITVQEMNAVTVRMIGYSWGAIEAANVSRKLREGRIGGLRLEAPVPIKSLVLIDPVHVGSEPFSRFFKHTNGPQSNVEHFYNYYQRRGGTSTIEYYLPNTNIKMGEEALGNWFSASLKGASLRSTAQNTVQKTVTTDAFYAGHEVLRPYTPSTSGVELEGRLRGDEANHDTMPWYIYDIAKNNIESP